MGSPFGFKLRNLEDKPIGLPALPGCTSCGMTDRKDGHHFNQKETMKKYFLIAAIAMAALLTACGPEKVNFDTLETARNQGKANAEWNAQGFRAANPQYSNTAIVAQTDSSMMPNCPQGDGWASVKLIDKANPALKVGLKCSTVSGSVGCLLDTDFQTKVYAGEDGHCQDVSKVPFPIPKIAK